MDKEYLGNHCLVFLEIYFHIFGCFEVYHYFIYKYIKNLIKLFYFLAKFTTFGLESIELIKNSTIIITGIRKEKKIKIN